MKSNNIVRSIFVWLVFIVIVIPRIPIIPAGYGELSIRSDGVISLFIGFLALIILSKKLAVIPLVILFLLYSNGGKLSLLSIGLYFQVISIITLPYLIKYYSKKDIGFQDFFYKNIKRIIITYALLNVGIAMFSQKFIFEICTDNLTKTGCIGSYGLLDRPYIFSVFIGVAFVFLLSEKKILYIKALILLLGLAISDSRAISAAIFAFGLIVYLKTHKISLKNIFYFCGLAVVVLTVIVFNEGKMSLNNFSSSEVDPSWLMRSNNIDLYFEWIDSYKLLLGDGALAFYQFSDAYGQPGPVDNLYIRLASEIGIIGGIFFIYLYLNLLLRSAIISHSKLIFVSYIATIALISIFQESLIVSRAGHAFVLLGVFLCGAYERKLTKPKYPYENKRAFQ